MSDLTNKLMGFTMSAVGGLAVPVGIAEVVIDPKNYIGYCTTLAGIGCVTGGIKYLKKAYAHTTNNQRDV